MKFQVLSSDLMSHLSAISRVLTGKNTMPILDNFLFEINENTLKVTASDGDTTMITNIAITEVEGSGRFVVPSKTLLDPLKEMPQQMLNFDIDGDNLEIFVYYANGKYNFIAGKAEEYPTLKDLDAEAHEFSLSSQALLNGIGSTLFATADDDLRPVMNGIYFDVKPEYMTFVASDSKKLVRLINQSVKAGFEASFILPKKPATLLRSIISKDMGEAKVTFDSKSARIQLTDYQISCRLIEGKFPRYESVIPKNNTNKMIVGRQDCINTLRRISVFASQATNQVKFNIDKDILTVSAQDVDFSIYGTEKITCSYSDTPMQIGFRANFLIEILNTIPSDEVEFQLADSFRACLIVPVQNNENEDLLMLIMPMQLADFGN
ncbi:MAG: DNA polymerase III subunit beta [Bacteroidales bacterium]|nr:DNA polymerase III subunit beta [Bacteroidales bacterium]